MRVFARRTVRLAVLAGAFAALVFALLHTTPAKRAASRMVLALLEKSLGGSAAFQSFDYTLWRGEIRVEGFSWTSEETSLRAREVLVRYKPYEPLDVRVENPDVRVAISGTPGAGRSAIPAFLLGLQMSVADGSLRLEWPEGGRTLELTSIAAELRPEGSLSRVTLGATSGRLREGNFDVELGPAQASVRLTPTEVQIDEARVSNGASFVAASGRLGPLSPLAGELRFEHSIEGTLLTELDSRIQVVGFVEGEGTLRRTPGSEDEGAGRLRAHSVSLRSLGPLGVEAGWRFRGRAASADVTFESLDSTRLPSLSSGLSGRFQLEVADADFVNARGEGLVTLRAPARGGPPGIPLRGDVRLRLESREIAFDAPRLATRGITIAASGRVGASVDARVRARVEDVRELDSLLPLAGAPVSRIPFQGPLNVEATVAGSLDAPSLDARGTSDSLVLGSASFALEGRVALNKDQLRLDQVTLSSGLGGTIVVDGEVPLGNARSSSLSARVENLELSGLVPKVSSGRLSASLAVSGAIARPTVDLSFRAEGVGTPNGFLADVSGVLRGQGLEGRGELHLKSTTFEGRSLPGMSVDLESDGSAARLKTRLDDGRELLEADVDLRFPYALVARIPLENVPFADIRALFPELVDAEMALDVVGRATIEGSLAEPGSLRYRIEADRVLGLYRGIALGATSPFVITGTRAGFSVTDLTLVGEDTAIGIDGVIPLSRDGSVVLHARGASRLELLRPWFPEAELSGRANVDVRVEGALPDPWLRGELSLEEASARFHGILVESVSARASWSDRALVLESLSGEALGGKFQVSGELPPQLIDPSAPVHVRVAATDLRPLNLVSRDEPSFLEGTDLRVAVEGDLHGSGADLSKWQGGGTLPSVRLSARGLEVANEAPASWSLDEGRVSFSDFRMTSGTSGETRLVLSGQALPFVENPSWTVNASGRIDHEISRLFLEDLGMVFTGVSEISIRAEKTGGDPLSLEGRGTFSKARLVVRNPPIAFTNAEAEIALEGSVLSVTRLSAEAGGGRIEAEGSFGFEGGQLGDVDLRAKARSVRLNYPESLRSEVNGDLRLRGQGGRLRLTGDVDLARALLSRDISVESELLRSLSRFSAASAPSPVASKIELDLHIRATEAFRVDNNLARMEASVNLTTSGTLAAPELSGIASVRPGGRFRFGGNEYRVEGGRILLRGYPTAPAELDITARTSVGVYDIRLVLRGSTDHLSTELSSENHPELSRGDLASLLITGRTLTEISSASRDIVSNRMVSYLGSTLADLAKLGIGETLPFEIVTVEPSLIAGETDPGARFTIGARFNHSLSVVYSIGLDNAERQIWVVDYELPRRTRTQIVRDENNEYTFGLSQEVRFDVRNRSRGTARREVISDVSVTLSDDPWEVTEHEVRDRLNTKPGARFDYWKLWEKAEKLRRRLRSRGFLEAVVDVATTPRESGGIGVEYRVRVGPKVRFVYPEDEPGGSLENALENAWTGEASDSFLTGDLANLATGRLFQESYFAATAEVVTERSERELLVKVFLRRGHRGRNVGVEVTGNETVPDSVLLEALPKPRSPAFHDLLTTNRSRLKQIVALQYASLGFISASVGDPVSLFDEATGDVRVTLPVSEGPRFLVEAIELEGVSPEDEAELRGRLGLRVGEPFRIESFAQDRGAVAGFYRERGFVRVDVDSSVEERPGAAEVRVRHVVKPGPRVDVAEVSVQGNETTRESVIRREVKLTPGAPLSTSAVRETERGLYELGIFQSADVVVEEPSEAPDGAEPSSRTVRISVVETPDLELDYGGRASTDGFFEVLTELRAPNLFGRAHHAGLRALLGSERKIFRFSYHSPYLSRYRLDTDFFVERSIEHEGVEPFDFTDRIWTFTGQQTRPITKKINAQWSYTYRRLLTQFDPDFAGLSRTRSIVTGSVIGDHRDSLLRPQRGSFWLLTTQLAPAFLGSDLRYTKLLGQLFTYVSLMDDVVWASGFRLGAADSFGERLDPNDGFRAGGPNSVRGFEQDSLGPQDIVGPKGGGGLVVFNQEIRFPLIWRLRGVGFYDAGNAFETASDIRLSALRQSVGAGLRLELPFGLIRLDYAAVVSPRPGEKPWRLLFSLGDAF